MIWLKYKKKDWKADISGEKETLYKATGIIQER